MSGDADADLDVERITLVTGATSGIGAATAEALARRRWTVVIVGRSAARCESTVARIRQATGNPDVHFLVGDLSSQADVRRLAGEFRRRFTALHVLVNNAGGLFMNRRESVDGIELTFALNHLAPFLLTNLLLDVICGTASPRIVNVSSAGHRLARGIRRDDLQWRRGWYRGFKVYHHSKLANLLFTYELARRLAGTGVIVNAADPGLVATNIARDNPKILISLKPLFDAVLGLRYKSPDEGAHTVVHLAASPEVAAVTGRYFANEREEASSAASQDVETARWLWQASATLTGLS
jgi:NAD(P)-dependent dehydrogenase (short-subunit alcohol dehydrogenase family)